MFLLNPYVPPLSILRYLELRNVTVGSFEHGNEPSGSIKGGGFLD
jgi:hypothetical protein